MASLFPELPAAPAPGSVRSPAGPRRRRPLPDSPAASLPAGFAYRRDFLSEVEEAALLAELAGFELLPARWQEYTALRRAISFSLGAPTTASPAAPPLLRALALRVAACHGLPPGAFPQALVMLYPPGAPIGWHRDAPPHRAIYGVSLAGDCSFRLRPVEKRLQTKENLRRLKVERRSLYVIAGESRSAWQHSIAPVEQARWSITLRTLPPPR